MSRDLLHYHHLLLINVLFYVPSCSRSCSCSGLVGVRLRLWTTCRLVGRLSALVVLCPFDIPGTSTESRFRLEASRAPSDTRRRLQPTE
ncbi:hypothetical protein BDZ89DRAFT_487298 [Hymenopellis radicata]|nr:hypothetical protein BDZ89DRAFT_487298 [Hymenopellis radicata]